jgi:hypothetical protein
LVKVETGDSFLPREDWVPDDLYTADSELEKLTRGEPLSLMKHAGTADIGWDQEVSVPLSKAEKRRADGHLEGPGLREWSFFQSRSNSALASRLSCRSCFSCSAGVSAGMVFVSVSAWLLRTTYESQLSNRNYHRQVFSKFIFGHQLLCPVRGRIDLEAFRAYAPVSPRA